MNADANPASEKQTPHSGWIAFFILAGTVALGWIAAGLLKLSAERRH